MARLNGRQWGLVALVAGSPLFLAALLGAAAPTLLDAALGTVLGGLSWAVAALLGGAGGALYASGLARLETVGVLTVSPRLRSAGTVLAALPSLVLCVVPALFLLFAGPAFATALEHEARPLSAAPVSLRASASDFLGRLRRDLPRALPVRPGSMPW
ncbi:hypothetical protein P2318_18300 [Myxococcaceae bacterium GXIMD 01537]